MTRKILATTTEQQDVIYKFMETNYIPVREIKLWAHISQIVFKAPFTNNTITADLNKYAISENDKLLYHYLSEVLQALISYIVPQNKEDKTTTCHLYSAIRFSSDPERLKKRSIDNTQLDITGAGSQIPENNTTPMPNVNYTIRVLKKSDLSAKNLKSGELEPILESLYKLREYNHRASREAKERLEIATRSLLAVTELLYSLNQTADDSILEGEVTLRLSSLCPTLGLKTFKYKNAFYHAKNSESKQLFEAMTFCKHEICKKPSAAPFIMDFDMNNPQACVQYINSRTIFVCTLEIPKSFIPCLNISLGNSCKFVVGSAVKVPISKSTMFTCIKNICGLFKLGGELLQSHSLSSSFAFLSKVELVTMWLPENLVMSNDELSFFLIVMTPLSIFILFFNLCKCCIQRFNFGKKQNKCANKGQVNKTSYRRKLSKAEIYERKRAGIRKACLELQPLTSAQAMNRKAALENYTL